VSAPGKGGRTESWGTLKRRLSSLGFRPSRRLGQNFLLDENMSRALVRDAGVVEGDFVLEVGPGLGFLTRPLLDAGARVLAVEIDGRLAELLRADLGEEPRFELVQGDVLAGKHELAPEVREHLPGNAGEAREGEEPWRLVANLPYSVSAPLLAVLAALPAPPVAMDVLVQLEVARRLAAEPGGRDWGPLSVRLQASYRVELGRRVGPELFWPRPKVDSAWVRLRRRADAPPREEAERLAGLGAALFGRRRQALGRVLGELLGDREAARALLEELGVEPRRRAETLDLGTLQALANSAAWRERD